MSKLEEKIKKIKDSRKIGIMAHVVIGYPTLEKTIKIVKTMEESGVDIMELQIPFSDPLADGPTIMRACEQSIKNGTKVKDAFSVMKTLSAQVSIPLLFMSYYNIIFKYGVEKFCQDAKKAGASGLIVPDMPVDEEKAERFYYFCKKNQLDNIQVVSPISTDSRLIKNNKVASGFIYCTTHQGITGAKDNISSNLDSYLKRVREVFSLPVALGFGISKKEHLQILKPFADIAIVGSAVIDVINNSENSDIEENVKNFINGLRI